MIPEAAGWIGLSAIRGLGGESFRKLLSAFGDPEAVLRAEKPELCRVVDPVLAGRILQGPDAGIVEAALKWLEEPGNGIVTLADPDYPPNLLNIPDPPPFLYVKGRRELLAWPFFAMVGSRNATPQGMENAGSFARALSDAGLCIVSGLALGIDAAAHEGGLKGASSSAAVVGTGLDIRYPAGNRRLAEQMEREGLVLSEFPLGTPPLGTNFPRRNRIISGLSLGCLVVEAGIRSGSLITARHAAEQGREVFAVPGSIHSPLSKGPHRLIKEGAKLAECAQDILDELRIPFAAPVEPEGKSSGFLDRMGFDPVDPDTLCARTGLSPQTVSELLLSFEMEGRVASIPGGMYQRKR